MHEAEKSDRDQQTNIAAQGAAVDSGTLWEPDFMESRHEDFAKSELPRVTKIQ